MPTDFANPPANLSLNVGGLGLKMRSDQVDDIERVLATPIEADTYELLRRQATKLEVGAELSAVVRYFGTAEGTPAGFRRELALEGDTLVVDLKRDIAYDKNGTLRPTKVLYSADSANPYEVAPIAPFLANLTCNPGIIYDLFINNPRANVGGEFKTRDEVITALGDVLGPGCDVSVELNNPFEKDFNKILEEAERFREILSPWRVVIKVPHTGPVNAENYDQLLEGDRKLRVGYDQGTTQDALNGHQIALKLQEHGYRVNFTLMFEPYQTQMALQARPYFINSFIRHRKMQSERIIGLLKAYQTSGDAYFLEELRRYFVANDYLPADGESEDLLTVLRKAESVLADRSLTADTHDFDGLDSVRHNLRALRNANLPDTRLIICSMEGDRNYRDIDSLLNEPEFADVADRVVLTAEPAYLARFTSTNQVVNYQRRFMSAANGQA
ncbi:transaldolase family protein [Actinomycetaceae bacterium MB13-C1-2]|nr:transaldolase family protein [Actinomycetaceae bacterium MB13-C1-2]